MNSYHSTARHAPSSRLAEMLDAIKAEFDNVLAQEASAYKNYKDEYEHKSEQPSLDPARGVYPLASC